MKIMIISLMVLLAASSVTAKPGGTYTLTGEEKGVEEIVKKDMDQNPNMYKGEDLPTYLRKFKAENKIGKRKYKPGDELFFPDTQASIKMKNDIQAKVSKISKAGEPNLMTFSKIDKAWETSQGENAKVAVLDWLFDMSPEASTKYTMPASMVPGEDIGVGKPWHGEWMVQTINMVAPKAMIIPIRARTSGKNVQDEDGRYAYEKYLTEGIRYAADHGAAAVTCSMGPVTQCKELQDAIDYAESKGTIFVNVHPPESSKSSYIDKRIINTGVVSVSKHPVKPESNRDIYTWPYQIDPVFQDGWGYSQGPPITAGVIALMKAANPQLTPKQIRSIIIDTAYTKDGFKVLDADAAVIKSITLKKN